MLAELVPQAFATLVTQFMGPGLSGPQPFAFTIRRRISLRNSCDSFFFPLVLTFQLLHNLLHRLFGDIHVRRSIWIWVNFYLLFHSALKPV